MIIVMKTTASKEDVEKVQSLLAEINEESYVIGEVTNSGSVDLTW